jgi:hypothetical protein
MISVTWNSPRVTAGRTMARRPEAVKQAGRPEPETDDLAAAEGRQQSERHREDENEQNAGEEDRQGDADEGYSQEERREPRAAVERRVDAHRDAEQKREQRRDERKLDRRREALADNRHHRLLKLIGNAKIEMQRVPHETTELNDDGIVKPERLAQLGALRDARFQSNHLIDGIAHEAEQSERDKRHHEHYQHGLERAADEKGKHAATSIPAEAQRPAGDRTSLGAMQPHSFRNQ